MRIREAAKKLDKTLMILAVLVLIAVAAAFWTGGGQLIVSGFTLGGLVQVLVPRGLIAKWLGPTSGIKGIFIGSYTGIIMSGAPYVFMPVIASIYTAGAGAGPIIALLAGQGLIGLQNLIVWHIPFLGLGIPLAKYIAGLFLAPFVGLAGAALFRVLGGLPETVGGSGEGVSKAGLAEGRDKAGEAEEKGDKAE